MYNISSWPEFLPPLYYACIMHYIMLNIMLVHLVLSAWNISGSKGEKRTDTTLNKDVFNGLALGSIVVNPSGVSLPCIIWLYSRGIVWHLMTRTIIGKLDHVQQKQLPNRGHEQMYIHTLTLANSWGCLCSSIHNWNHNGNNKPRVLVSSKHPLIDHFYKSSKLKMLSY